ncbi:MAG TPA: hypothetical protein VJQ54_16635 [Candidatus Sulfotelmatobacter sp.]|nr:hypothetical protein [Candidatus Sulfotelmatobacter sp.]
MLEIPKIVRERLQSTDLASDSHPDPNVLTAFAEKLLSQAERTTVLGHLSRCRDCREILALALPASEPVQIAVRKTSAGWLAWPSIRWAFATAALVVAGAIGFLVYGHHDQSMRMAKNAEAPANLHASEEPVPPPQADRMTANSPVVAPTAKDSTALMVLEKSKKALAPAAEATTKVRNYSNPVVPGRLPHGPRQINQWQQQSNYAEQGAAALAANEPAKQQASVGTAGASPAAQNELAEIQTHETGSELKSETADSLIVNNRTSPQPNASDAEVSRAKSAPVAPPPVPTPVQAQSREFQAVLSNLRWTVTSGRLQRSFDGGGTWQEVNVNANPDTSTSVELTVARKASKASQKRDKQEPPAPVVFRVVTSNGFDVWAGGNNAALYHSYDAGSHWLRMVPTSGNATMSGDVLTLDFPQPHRGRVSTSTGETWTTSDGQTWQKQ